MRNIVIGIIIGLILGTFYPRVSDFSRAAFDFGTGTVESIADKGTGAVK